MIEAARYHRSNQNFVISAFHNFFSFENPYLSEIIKFQSLESSNFCIVHSML